MKPKSDRADQQNLPVRKYQPPKRIKRKHQVFLKRIGKRIEELRNGEGISIAELCRQSSISRFSYYLIIGGQVYWNSQTVLDILSALKTNEVEFFSSLEKRTISK